MIKLFFKLAVAILLIPAFTHATEHNHESHVEAKLIELLVYKTPTCGCCKKWITHIEDEGVIAHSKDYRNISNIKTKYGIKPNYRSCHTAVTRNGLSVPAMPVGSPGMEVGERFMPYNVLILFKDGTSEVYAEVKTYEEQF